MTVFTTWELCFQLKATGAAGERSAELLTLFAFFNWKDISEKFFKLYCIKEEPAKKAGFLQAFVAESKGHCDRDLLLDVLSELRSLSLRQHFAEEPGGHYHFSLYPLIRDWIRLRTDSQTCQKHSLLTADMIAGLIKPLCKNGYFEMPLSAKQEVLSYIDVHKENYNDFLKLALLPDATVIDFAKAKSWFHGLLEDSGLYAEAEAMNRRVTELFKTMLGTEHIHTSTSMRNFGNLLRQQRRYNEAERTNRQVLDLNVMFLGPEHRETLASMNNLAAALSCQNKYEEAEDLHWRELSLCKRVLASELPETLVSMNNLAVVLEEQGRLEEFEIMQREELGLCEEVLGLEHPVTLTYMQNLSVLLQKQENKVEEAETLQRRLIPLRVKLLGAEHPNTLLSIHTLA